MEGALVKAMLKSALLASLVFTLAWVRWPWSRSPVNLAGIFLWYGILITIFSMIIGIPLARLIERLKIGRWWSYLVFGAATGALLGAVLSSHPSLEGCVDPRNGEQETCIENPMAITFSPWKRSQPGFAGENPPIQWSDYIGTIAFGAVIGGVLGISFWFFYRCRARSGIEAIDP
jgi:hypothetical protein